MLLDTTFLVDLLRGDAEAIAKAEELEAELIQQHISSMTLFELYYGVARADQPTAEREIVEEVLATKPVYPADTAVMRKAGQLAGELANDGTTVGDGDVIIGATASVIDEPVLTRNTTDFERIGVDTRTY